MIWVQRFIFLFIALCLFASILAFIEHAPYFYVSMSLFFILIFIAMKSTIIGRCWPGVLKLYSSEVSGF